jgi:hypothetical protein
VLARHPGFRPVQGLLADVRPREHDHTGAAPAARSETTACRSSEPLQDGLTHTPCSALVQADHAPAGGMRVQLDLTVALADDEVGEPGCATVLRAARVDHAPVSDATNLIVGHGPTVAPKRTGGTLSVSA